ncbi:MAG: hypothetical protein CMK06_01130 [Ponticaulis sp.]|nr:hypothetical protein [Ponticaulis sp.]|tara:strand:+ start:28399 stop:28908 length:510 start_codon:yes stop_codon:yes gene_type:complete
MSIDKLSAAVHYVIAKDSRSEIGKTKLNKILWFADCAAWRKFGKTVTGLDAYAKLQYGPVPPNIDLALLKLQTEHRIKSNTHYVGTYQRFGYLSLQAPNADNLLSSDERAVLDDVLDAVSDMTAFDVSELSHDALWEATPHGEMIPVQAAASQFITPDERILEWARKSG